MLVADDNRQRSKAAQRQARIKARERFKRAHRAEKGFARQLKAVAKQVGAIVKGFAPSGYVSDWPVLNDALKKYSDLLRPWATAITARMIAEVSRRDETSWNELGRSMGQELKREIRSAPTGIQMREKLEESVGLITSLPLEAAQRVHKLTLQGILNGTRARETAKEILRTGEVTQSRAMLIARTETTRTATALVEARALHVGSLEYIWRTAHDSDVRQLHKDLEGTVHRWSEPPVAGENGERAHPGSIYNCRCWPEPILPDIIQ